MTSPATIRQAADVRLARGGIGLALRQRHEDVQGVRVEGEPDVRRRRPRRRPDVGVDDRPEHLVGLVRRERQAEQVGRVDLVAVRRRSRVAGRLEPERQAALGSGRSIR